MPPLPSCECIQGKPLNEIAAAIYCAFYSVLIDPMNLPDCECVRGRPLADILASIYCAVLQYTQQPFTGTINPDQISGITPFGIGALTSNPDMGLPLFWDGSNINTIPWSEVSANVTVSISQISNATPFGQEVLGLNASPFTLVGCNDVGNAVMADGAQAAFFMTGGLNSGATAGASPPTQVQTINGITIVLT